MHYNNRLWLQDLKKEYPNNFKDCRVLEIGSLNVNGTARDYFENCDYIGVDRDGGLDVDIAVDARETHFDRQFDTLLILSVFEHDLDWKETLRHNLKWLKRGGMCFVCFGAEGNKPHMDIWAIVPHQEFLDECKKLDLKVLDAFFEEDRYGLGDSGVYNLVLKK